MSSKLTVGSLMLGGALLIATGLGLDLGGIWNWMPTPRPPDPPVASDCLSEAYAADRNMRVKMLLEFSDTDFANDKDKNEWHTEASRNILGRVYRQYLDELATHIVNDTVEQFAESLR